MTTEVSTDMKASRTRNSSLILPRVIGEIAHLQGRTPKEVERVTAENAIGLYRLNHQ